MAKEDVVSRVKELAEEYICGRDLEIYNVEYRKEGPEWKLRVYLDKPADCEQEFVNIEECEAIEITVAEDQLHMIAKVCYEIGNRHAPLFWGKDRRTFLTPYNEPMLILIRKIPGVEAMVVEDKFDFDNRISTSVSSHSH